MTLDEKILELPQSKYFIVDDFLSSAELRLINLDIDLHKNSFKSASTGMTRTHNTKTRGDLTYWMGESENTEAQNTLLDKISVLTEKLNSNLFLGIWSNEFHYSVYPVSTSYQTHVDRFKDNSSRVVSVILYLNEEWNESDGGQLVLHLEKDKIIFPLGGRLVCFISEDLSHEVLICNKERRSFTGWLKKRNL